MSLEGGASFFFPKIHHLFKKIYLIPSFTSYTFEKKQKLQHMLHINTQKTRLNIKEWILSTNLYKVKHKTISTIKTKQVTCTRSISNPCTLSASEMQTKKQRTSFHPQSM